MTEHGRSRIVNPRVALTAILSLTPASPEPEEEYITADSWNFLAGQQNLLAPLEGDPTLSATPVLTLSQITPISIPQPEVRTKPGRRICRHIFPCGSPLDIRMRYNPMEPPDYSLSTEIVLLSVDLSVTPHTGASVLIKDVNVEMGGGTVTPMTEIKPSILKRYDVLTLLFRYERYDGDGGRKTVSTNATMVPLLSGSEETSPVIQSLWNKILDIPSLASVPFSAPTQRAVSQIMTPSNSHRSSPSITGKPRGVQGHGRAQTVVDFPPRPGSAASTSDSPVLAITVEVPSKGVKPGDEFSVSVQCVNRARRPVKLMLQVDAQTGQSHTRTHSRLSRTDKLLPRLPVSASLPQPTLTSNKNHMTEAEVLEYYLQERELNKTKGIYPLTVEGKLGCVRLRKLLI
jgi:TRAPP trafficking subunit Trs65